MAEANDLKSNDDGIQNLSKTQMEINECLGSWLTYLQVIIMSSFIAC